MEDVGYPIIILGSALHGSGRSHLADLLQKDLKEEDVPAKRISAGAVFRQVAEDQGLSIGEFAELQTKDPEKFYVLNVSVDSRIHELMLEESQRNTVIVDSNLAAYHADVPNAYAVLIYSKPEIIGERVFRAKRRGDEAFPSPKDALEQMVKRTADDIKLYRQLSKIARENFWKMVYRVAAEDLGDGLGEILRGGIPKSPFFHKTVDNCGAPEDSLEEIKKLLEL